MPNAKTAVGRLKARLAELLTTLRTEASATITDYQARIEQMDEFVALDNSKQAQVLEASVAALAAVTSDRFAAGIRNRVHVYVERDYPEQLTLLTRLATPLRPDLIIDCPGPNDPPPPPPPVKYTRSAELKPKCKLPYIATEAELDEWLDALRDAALTELGAGRRISL